MILCSLCLGHTRAKHPSESRFCLVGGEFTACLYQSRFVSCVERHQLSRRCFHPHLILRHNQLLDLEAFERPTTASAEMESGKMGLADQYRRSPLSNTFVVLCFLAFVDSGDATKHELVLSHVCECPHNCPDLVLHQGSACLRRACDIRQARSLSCSLRRGENTIASIMKDFYQPFQHTLANLQLF